MKHLLILHIHGCFASCATGDKWLYNEIPEADIKALFHAKHTPFFLKAYAKLSSDNQRYFDEAVACVGNNSNAPFFIREIVEIPGWTVYYTAETTHYHRGLHERLGFETADLSPIINLLLALGWTKTKPADYATAQAAYDAAEAEKDIRRRTEDGYLFPSGDAAKPRAAFQGGLSDELFNHPKVVEYMKEKTDEKGLVSCWGYLGNSNRKMALDRVLETHLRDYVGWTVAQIADWVCSREGRHMADSFDSIDGCMKWGFQTVEAQDRRVAELNRQAAGMCK